MSNPCRHQYNRTQISYQHKVITITHWSYRSGPYSGNDNSHMIQRQHCSNIYNDDLQHLSIIIIIIIIIVVPLHLCRHRYYRSQINCKLYSIHKQQQAQKSSNIYNEQDYTLRTNSNPCRLW